MRVLFVSAIWVASAILAALLNQTAEAFNAPLTVLDHLALVESAGAIDLEFHFAEPVRYIRHAPVESGSAMQILIEPLAPRLDPQESLRSPEVVHVPSTSDHPIENVRIDHQLNGNVVIDIQFDRHVEFELASDLDLRTLRLRLLAPALSEKREPAEPLVSQERLDELMHEGRIAMTAQDYDRASLIFGQVARMPDNAASPDALELLGLARERKQQWAHARAEYEEYLDRYPDGEGASRVRQRLATLDTSRGVAPQELPPEPEDPRIRSWESFGSTYLGYRRETLFTDEGKLEVDSALYSDAFIDVRHRRDTRTLRGRFSGSSRYDFLNDGDELENEIHTLSFSGSNDVSSFSWSAGRMRRSGSGVLGRFDGLQLDYRLGERWGLGLVAGAPIDSTDIDELEFGRSLAGISLDLRSDSETVDAEIFAIGQSDGGMIERAAIGGEFHYFDAGRMLAAFIDYDVLFNSLNVAQLLGSWQVNENLFVSGLIDHRNAPILTLQNALIGQPADDLDELRDLFSEDEIRDLAEDRTAQVTTANLNATYRLTPTLQLAADFGLAKLSGTEDSGGIEGFSGTGMEFSYVGRLIANDSIAAGDTIVGSLGYFDGSQADSVSARIDARFPLTRQLRFNPRVWVDYRMFDGGGELLRTIPSVRFDYRWRSLTFEAESGFEWELPSAASDSARTGYFLTLGLRHDF